jgi:hypothetical protein
MKKILLILFLLLLLYAPFLATKSIKSNYAYYESIAKKYDCYPIEICKSDFNNDGKADIFSVVNDPKEKERYNYRLKVFVEQNNQIKEILNIKYDQTDNTLRTHVAVFEENGQKKLLVYDTINTQQFFFWDGNQLLPTNERTQLESEIWKALSLEDDTGGFNEKILFDSTLIPLFTLYYLLLSTTIGMYFYFQKKLKLKLS